MSVTITEDFPLKITKIQLVSVPILKHLRLQLGAYSKQTATEELCA